MGAYCTSRLIAQERFGLRPNARMRAGERPLPVAQRWDLRGSGSAHPEAKRFSAST